VVETLNSGRRQYLLVRDKDEAYARAQTEPTGVIIRQANLEDVFIQLTGERRGAAPSMGKRSEIIPGDHLRVPRKSTRAACSMMGR